MNIGIFILMLVPALIMTITTAMQAKTINARWRERRAARLAARAARLA